MADTIIKIQPSDLISDSMLKINHNFEIISNRDDVTESKLNQWIENIENQLDDIRNENGIISDGLLNNVHKLENKIDNITDLDAITKEVQNAINNATIDVEKLINEKADEVIPSKLGDYAKTSYVDESLKGYVASTAFDTYKSDSSKSMAQSSRIVANSKFLKLPNKDLEGAECLVTTEGEITEFKSVEEYFKSLSDADKSVILGDKTFDSDDEALEDPDVIAKLIGMCEKTFKTVVTEMSVISQNVGPGYAESSIISAVKGPNGKTIAASIFTKANNEGESEIVLNADRINLDTNHKLTLNSGTFEINSSNFTLNDNGLVLSGRGGKTRIDANGILHAQGADIQGTITADRFESEKTDNYVISIDTKDYSGVITKKTLMNSNEFCIESIGKFSPNDGVGSDIDVTGNKLYIKIMDKLPNANEDIKDASGETASYLYGVPVLCMMYNNVEYQLSPASWFIPSSGDNPTDMYFIGGGDNNTYSYVKSSKTGFYRPSQKNVHLSLSSCKKYVFAYSNPGNESSYNNILFNAGLINGSNVGVTTYDVTPTGLIKTTQSVGKIPIAVGENLNKFKANIKPSCDIYQRFMDGSKIYFGDFSGLPYVDDVGDTTTPEKRVPQPEWFNSNIFNYIKDNLNTGNWSYGEGIDSSQQSSEPQVDFNPFNVDITGGICGSISYNIVGYYKQSYVNGFQTNTSSVNGFADCEYVATIYFNDLSKVTTSVIVDGTPKNFYATSMNVRVSFGVYRDNTTESELIELLKSGDITNIDEDVHIEADIDLSSSAEVVGYDSISFVYNNN